jgi:Zn-dependent protease with chaperone function
MAAQVTKRSGLKRKVKAFAQPGFPAAHPSDALIQQCRCLGRCAWQKKFGRTDRSGHREINSRTLEEIMNTGLSRALVALAIAGSLWMTSIAAVAAPRRAQDQKPASTTQQQDQDKTAKNDQQTTQPSSGKTLSTNEDPNMIGKRNINKGIWGRMAGGTESEVKLGRQLAAEVEREAKFVDDPIITEYVNRVGQNIVLHSDAKIPFTIRVIDSDEVNAFALPGGFFFVNKGLILAADNEAELAGVMAHEIAHVAARHAMENQRKMQIIDYGLLAGVLLGGGIIGNVLYNAGGLIEGLSFLKFSRGAEEEADKLGVQYMWAAGYDPNAMATMFEKLEAKNKKKPGTIAKTVRDTSGTTRSPSIGDCTCCAVSGTR